MRKNQTGFQPCIRRLAILMLCLLPVVTTSAQTTAKGSIEIVVPTADSVIWIDGVSHGKAGENRSLKASGFSIGRHTIRIRTVGYQDAIRPVLVRAGATTTLKVAQLKLEDDAVLHLQKGDALREGGDQEAAINEYRTAIEQQGGEYPDAYIGLARSLLAKGDLDAATEAAQKAIAQRPTSAEAHTVLANILRKEGDDEATVKEYQTAIRLAHGFSPEGHTGLALTYSEMDNTAAAIREMQIGIRQNADTEPLLYYLLGSYYEKQQDNARAIESYETYLKLAPNGKLASALKSMIPQMKRDIQTSTERP